MSKNQSSTRSESKNDATGKQVTRRCHWVAQSYLKAFSADDGRRIWRFSKHEGDPELKRIDKVAVKFHLYAPMGADGRRNDALEKKLAEVENFYGEPMWKAVCNDFPDFSWEPLRKMVALLAAITWLRTPKQFEYWKSVHQQFVDFFSQHDNLPDFVYINDQRIKLDHSDWLAYRDATEENMKGAWNEWLSQSAGIAEIFLRMRWAIIVSDKPAIVTSDNPVMVGDTLGPHRGLKHPDALVTFPLSPTRVLVMDNRHSEPDAQFYSAASPAAINSLIWRNAIEHMFSPRNPDEVCAEIDVEASRMGF
ncbi:DUF4238 domain-containing protein [Paraburkholderia tropica]|uniref:DUF4238 domain-containing protein n=1 Tax=Paraburkholderia tropica TaxID=92647 RepID=UPI0009F734F9|nr:DUF4238 domain-containing protein [Paraburkholderia tropica]